MTEDTIRVAVWEVLHWVCPSCYEDNYDHDGSKVGGEEVTCSKCDKEFIIDERLCEG